ncbi:FIG01199342: hypothetical protein [hydrothermal vent metagenome]|uniref:Peptidase S24/S26A/S26B/S26C domain-containing protein n=1 Tax=hydrothermal vent metagenome TaxID=652676 RepID=A0A1W1BUE3_9ZZZZ
METNELFQTNCDTNSESYALQNLGSSMEPEFSENCIIIIDPGMQPHNQAYVVIEYQDEFYFRQYIEENNKKFIKPLNPAFHTIELIDEFSIKGCVVQQKQRKQKPKHYYHLNPKTKTMDFSLIGKEKKFNDKEKNGKENTFNI